MVSQVPSVPVGIATLAPEQGLRPRLREDYAEQPCLSVSETTVGLRKEELLRLLIAGKRVRDAAKILRLSAGTVRTYIKCPEFQQKLWNHDQRLWQSIDEELRSSKVDMIVRIREASDQALERIVELMDSDDESISFRASSDILDRNPETSKRSKQDTTSTNVSIDFNALILAAQVEQEMEGRLVESSCTAPS